MLKSLLVAMDRDYQVVLGANTPFGGTARLGGRAACRAIVLSGSMEIAAQVIDEQLPYLLRQVKIPVFIGGKVTTRY